MAETLAAAFMMHAPLIEETNVRSAAYLLAQSVAVCGRCLQPTSAFSLGLLPGHERQVDGKWEPVDVGALLFYVDYLPPEVILVAQELSLHFRLDYSRPTATEYWINHCQNCGELLEDHDMHCEPGGAFLPLDARDAGNILLVEVRESFSARVRGCSYDLPFFASMQTIA
jgi:hypothetical protein